MTWKDETDFKCVDDLFTRLFSLGEKDNPVACRGQADSSWILQTSLDRILDPNADYATRLAAELAVLEKFYILAHNYLGVNEEQRLNQAHANNKISALTLLQHYRAPTRMLDWTHSPWIALYFAVIEHHDKDGVIWWFYQKAFQEEIHRRWEDVYNMKRYPPINEVNLNDTAFRTDGPEWITILRCIVTFHRIEVQQGFFSVAGRLGSDHGALIADALSEGQFARIVIPALWKQEILNRLHNMNINSRSLDYPGADFIGAGITRDLKRTQRHNAQDQ